MASFPRGAVERTSSVETIFRFAKVIHAQEHEALRGQREAGKAVGKGAIAVEVAAGGEVALQGRGTLPHLAAAAGEAVIVDVERLMGNGPPTLREQYEKEQGGNTLCPPDIEPTQSHSDLSVSNRAASTLEDMDSLTFKPGRAFLSSNSTTVPWTAVFEDEGPAGYFYACDRSQETQEHSIMDAMLIYTESAIEDKERERIASVQWSRDGFQAVLYLDGTAQALIDFSTRTSFCRMNFPNYLEASGDGWRKSSHAWDEAAMKRFEASIYA
jgi:hypothetical protein